jgi:hypothetical protein
MRSWWSRRGCLRSSSLLQICDECSTIRVVSGLRARFGVLVRVGVGGGSVPVADAETARESWALSPLTSSIENTTVCSSVQGSEWRVGVHDVGSDWMWVDDEGVQTWPAEIE